VEIKIQEFS